MSMIKRVGISSKTSKDSVEVVSNLTTDNIFQITNKEIEDVDNMVVNINQAADEINRRTVKGTNSSEKSLNLLEEILSKTTRLKEISDTLEYSSDNLQEMVGAFKIS
ncbi:hypothetical protein [Clostridium ljungdahlii]|uniref:Uncharacterized protein n=3 Tax=Clostridiaceae TaxID=31979 RepID=D8GLT9_CLOLD|nr:hypothetical protein CLJU_c04030 [Clostridium ljungdahlii DSM 13528]OAA89104.1 hypothetical protein WX45_02345 [Clostridium ljungdahlii DSM 13528]OAA94284.1 hypothetical protein WX73_03384 [Clostridium coskatii]OBR95660.1 hypothetical protein CLCOS_14530 [Clostridium coskatii]